MNSLSKNLKKQAAQVSLFALAVLLAAATLAAQSAQPERWLHVRVDNQADKGELVRVNVPLALAEKLLPTIHHEGLRNGKISLGHMEVEGVYIHALLDAVRTTRDGEFVTVQSGHGDVRVVKQAGFVLVHVREDRADKKQRVEIRVPMTVVEALLSSGNNELDLVAAIHALAAHGDTELVRVQDEKSTVRVWLDSRNTAE